MPIPVGDRVNFLCRESWKYEVWILGLPGQSLGFIQGGAARIGEVVRAWDGVRGADIEVEICPPCFIDPEGARLRG